LGRGGNIGYATAEVQSIVVAKIVIPKRSIPGLVARLRAGVQDEDQTPGVHRLVQ